MFSTLRSFRNIWGRGGRIDIWTRFRGLSEVMRQKSPRKLLVDELVGGEKNFKSAVALKGAAKTRLLVPLLTR